MDLSVIIPAYNEERRLGGTIDKVFSYLQTKPISFEVVVVDDGSQDGTAQVVREKQTSYPNLTLLPNEKNQGKGRAVRQGVLAARGAEVLFSDADLSAPIEEYEKLSPKLKEGYSIVIASRELKESQIKQQHSKHRKTLRKIFNFCVKALTGVGFQDTQCGFKLFTREAVQIIFPKLQVARYAFDVEVLWLANRLNVRACEVPVRWVHKPASQINVLRDGARMFWDIVQIRLNDFKGRYQ